MGRSGDGKRSIKLGWPSAKKKFYCKNEILFIHVPRTFLLESGRGGKAQGTRLNPDCRKFFLFFPFIMLFKQSPENYLYNTRINLYVEYFKGKN